MKFLIIGAGMIGEVHAKALKEMGLPFAVCDAKKENAQRIAEEVGAEEWYTDYQTAVSGSGADAAIVCTPNHLHAAPSVYCMEHGLDVICEKPIASKLEDAKAIVDAQKRTGRVLMVGYPVRCRAILDYVKEKLDEGVLGKITSARCLLAAPATLTEAKTPYRNSYETGGGIIFDYTHEIDYCRYLLGEPDYVAAFVNSFTQKDLTVDDNAEILLHYETGPVLQLHMDYVQWTGRGGGGRSFEIVGEKGILECDFGVCKISFYNGEVLTKDFGFVWGSTFPVQIDRFMRAVAGEKIPYVTAEDGYRVLEIAEKSYQSAREKSFVKL